MSAAAPARPDAPARPGAPAGRHRRVVPSGERIGRAADAVGRLGSLVTLGALMVLGATAGGLADGVPVTQDATVTMTFEER